jgi:hypothetical protein
MGETDRPRITYPITLDYHANPHPEQPINLDIWALCSCLAIPIMPLAMLAHWLLALFLVFAIPSLLIWLSVRVLRRPVGPANRRRAFVALAIAAGQIAFVLAILLVVIPSFNRGHEHAIRIKCASNLRQIGQGIALYANDNAGQLPLRFDQLISDIDISLYVFICPSCDDEKAAGPTTQAIIQDFAQPGRCSYIYLGAGLNIKDLAPTFILAHEKMENHKKEGIHILYADGSVTFHPANDARRILDALAAGQNPPP